MFVCLAGTGSGKVHKPGLELGTPKAYKNLFLYIFFQCFIIILGYFVIL